MRVTVVTHDTWPSAGGGELATYLHIRNMINRGFDFTIHTRRGRPMPFPIKTVRIDGFGSGKFIKYSSSWLKKFSEDVTESDLVYLTEHFDLVPIINKIGVPAVIHLHSYFPSCPMGHLFNHRHEAPCFRGLYRRSCLTCILKYEAEHSGIRRAMVSALMNRIARDKFINYIDNADKVLYVSNFQERIMKDLLSIEGEVVPNPPPPLEPISIKGESLGYIGGKNPIKGYQLLLSAWKGALDYLKSGVSLHIAGSMDLKRGIPKVINYGLIEPDQMDFFYAEIKGLIVPSLAPETYSYAAMEASLRARPVIITNATGFAEEVNGLTRGVRIIDREEEELVNSIKWMASLDPDEAYMLGMENREVIIKLHSFNKTTGKLISVFRSVAGS